MGKTFVIGDIHGCFDEFMTLIEKAKIGPTDTIIAVGDIVDRGPKSLDVYRYFKNRPHCITLMGNHERKHLRGILSYSQEIVRLQFGDEYDEFVSWLNSIPYYYVTDDAIIVHAFYEHDKALEEQKEDVLSGTTAGSRYLEDKYKAGSFWSDYYQEEKPIIYGHHVVGAEPKTINNTHGIDTGACVGGRLTALELPAFKFHQVEVGENHWKSEQARWQIPVLKAKDWESMQFNQIAKEVDKLRFKQDPQVREFFSQLESWVNYVLDHLDRIQKRIEKLTVELQNTYQDRFNPKVSELQYGKLVFKCRQGKLGLEELKRSLNTPAKIMTVAQQIGIGEVKSLHGF